MKNSNPKIKSKYMTKEEIIENLCYYDSRNPDCFYDDEEIQQRKEYLKKKNETCACDNCFYGRHKLADELLKHIKE